DVDALPGKGAKPEPRELKLASQIIGSLATDWDPKRDHDTYTEELKELIEAKAKGKKNVVEDEAPAEATVVDLMEALEASLEAARKGGGPKLASEVAKVADQLAEQADDDEDEGGRKRRAKKAAPKKSAAKKSAGPKKATATKAASRKSA
ncbi:MAG TPA: hypothetical protein VGV86_09285, partial [Acidimicrobiales bacterium]|nr:hypothetical protein [Acidimicrobiales bacterium]